MNHIMGHLVPKFSHVKLGEAPTFDNLTTSLQD